MRKCIGGGRKRWQNGKMMKFDRNGEDWEQVLSFLRTCVPERFKIIAKALHTILLGQWRQVLKTNRTLTAQIQQRLKPTYERVFFFRKIVPFLVMRVMKGGEERRGVHVTVVSLSLFQNE